MGTPIQVYLIRHGIAAERGDAFPDDTKRPLTSQGVARLRSMARALNMLEVGFDQILTSPLVRAKQTADVLAKGLQTAPPIAMCPPLAPGGKYTAIVDELSKHARRARIALIGHEPDLGVLASKLLGARGHVEFRKGAICRIDFDTLPPTGPGHLIWFLPPKVLRRVKR